MHHIAGNWNELQRQKLAKYNIEVSTGTLSTFQIPEDSVYNTLEPYFKEWRVVDMLYTEFSKKELDEAKWLVLQGIWENGYPQPEDDFGYLKETYNLNGYCKMCGIGAIQESAFRIKKEPKWGSKKMFQLTWVYDELFVEKSFYEEIFKINGIDSKPVLLHKSGEECKTIVQLDLPSTDLELSMEDLKYQQCPVCHRKKYLPEFKCFFPNYSEEHKFMIFKGLEFFGSGAQAYNQIFISQELRQLLVKEKVIKSNQGIPLGE